jgi:pyridinium-3,5-biscarboxylic acid mononucleotide synthase
MKRDELKTLAEELLAGGLSTDQFAARLYAEASAELGEVTIDLDRQRRCGFPEVIYGEGKSEATLEKTFRRLLAENMPVLATRVPAGVAESLLRVFPAARYNALARTFRVNAEVADSTTKQGRVAVVTAGTTDLPVAEEARETLDWMGVETVSVSDVGVAGPQRLPPHVETLRTCDAVVVVAGMEGALPSVVGGHVDCPVIAVPTSVGYGASFGGIAALLGMLTSCAANVCVVNIDAGFKGGYVAGLISRNKHRC